MKLDQGSNAPRTIGRSRLTRAVLVFAVASAMLELLPANQVRPADAGITLPSRPLPADYVEAFGEGKVLALHYAASYVCLTTPSSDVDGPFGIGDGRREAEDPDEYQLPPCFFGDTGTGSIPAFAPDGKPLSETRKLYGIALGSREMAGFASSPDALYVSNNAATTVQTQCAQPGPPTTQYTGTVGTCLMHPTVLREALDETNPAGAPDPLPLPQHSHVIEGTSSPLVWWQAVGVIINDASIWPDLDGNCPAGRSRCVTSISAMRQAQNAGLAGPDTPSNVFFYFSVLPESPQPSADDPREGSSNDAPKALAADELYRCGHHGRQMPA